MNSTHTARREIERFIKSPDPEVLCVNGEWGVGKTYIWQTTLERLRSRREVGLSRYSYVSLFGITSLEGLKTSIFENLEFLIPQARAGFEGALSGGNYLFKQGKQLIGMAGALPVVGGAISKGQPLLFASVRNQIICIDDLERRSGVSVKDVFGLISYLREQRGCKVALLLNQKQLEQDADAAKEFAGYFEKVIDTKLVFAPTTQDAVSIAIDGKDELSRLTAEHCVRLQISNIRVIKKIERLIQIIAPHIQPFGFDVTKQVVHSIAMLGWCMFDKGASPPPLKYITEGSLIRYIDRQQKKVTPTDEEKRWDAITSDYEWGELDDLDSALLRFVETGMLDVEELEKRAAENAAKRDRIAKAGSFSSAWDKFHESFSENEDEVCKALMEGFKNNFDVVSRHNLEEITAVLRQLDRHNEADDLISFAEKNCNNDFWASDDPFRRQVKDKKIGDIVAARQVAIKPAFHFEPALLEAAKTLDRELMAQLAAVPEEEYESLLAARTGDQLSKLAYAALSYRRIMNASDDMRAVVAKGESALRAIGKRSKLNELRLQKYSVELDPKGDNADAREDSGRGAPSMKKVAPMS